MIIYIHGFNSSSASLKSSLLKKEMARLGQASEFVSPDLPYEPAKAIRILQNLIEAHSAKDEVKLVGSSLGGYYATYLAENYGLKAVLVNPAVKPYGLLQDYQGPQSNIYTGEEYVLTQAHMEQLISLEVEPITLPARYLLMVQTGDEVLDYRLALEKYLGAHQIVVSGGDHGFQHFSEYIPRILAF
ncbi:YqiA/YcfP family alpha/beta fold hydrolase [Sulfurirhabdus autotrophica]|uniref:Esterase n=1 Tax=Sulfurirhabdus autotrophica TaxID=1706046 RepID=A0A4V2W218_9PROT|nr:YqiA/YcfP family alpha/beta fold hydrolase [Sulfurirhabdus autotrophica]TCV86349.1 hypothetical protein EDC63_10737 [Sulfurirhabdus autotrophica]